MHLPLSLILSLFSIVLPSLGSPVDELYILKVLSDYAVIADSGSFTGIPDFSIFNRVFTGNVSFDFGYGPQLGVVRGLANVETIFRKNVPPGTVTQNAVSTESISLSGFDDQGSASAATAVSYNTLTYFGQGDLKGQIYALYTRFDDTLVKTELAGNGGWRIAIRVSRYFVRRVSLQSLSDAQ